MTTLPRVRPAPADAGYRRSSAPDPAPAEGDPELKFSLVFANRKRKVPGESQLEIRLEDRFQGVRGSYFFLLAPPQPLRARGKLLEPGKWSRQQQLAAGLHQPRQLPEKTPRLREAANKIGAEHKIEGSQVGGQFHGVAHPEASPRPINAVRDPQDHFLANIALQGHLGGNGSPFPQQRCRLNESFRQIDAQDIRARSAKLER